MFANACYCTRIALISALPALGGIGYAQVIEIDEVISREVGIHIGGVSTPDIQEIVSRESSFFIENGRDDGEVISREFSVVMDAPGSPPQVTGYVVTPAPDGSSVALNWSNYNPWAVGDVGSFRIYLSEQPFSDVSGLTPFLIVPGETLTAILTGPNGLPKFQDHFIAIVAVDALGNANPAVIYSAAYILTKEIISREVSVAFNAEPQPPYREVVSREVSVVRDNPGSPAPLTDFVVTTSPLGDTATLNWSSYNQWAQYDVDSYRIYKSDTVITDLSGMPYEVVRGENFTYTFNDLTPWVDHYFAIVPVDALGNTDPVFNYGAAYVISPEVISREVGVFMGQEPPAPPDVLEIIPVTNSSFENPDIGNFIYWGSMSAGQRSAFGWTGAGNGVSGPALFNNGGAWNFTNVPNGSQGVSLQGSSSISQTFSLTTAGSYTLNWSAASRSGLVNPYTVQLNGSVISPTYSTSDTTWRPQTLTFEISTPGSYTIAFTCPNPSNLDNSIGIDTVSLSRFDTEGSRPFSSLRELVSREMSVVRPDATTPAPVTFAGSSFTAMTARTTYGGISLDWRSYNEWAQQDVETYRIYVSTSFFTDVSEMIPFASSADGTQVATITVAAAETIYYVAVVAEDVQGNFNPIVYPVSVKSAVAQLGPVANLTAVPTPTTLTFSWDLGGVGDELADFVKEFWVYFNGSLVPTVVPAAARSWTATSLTPETTYSVKVKTVDLLNAPSAELSGSATTLPIPPGTVDLGFNADVNGVIYTVASQPDGKMLIGGDFTTVSGVTRNRLARLNTDGTLDLTFNPNLSAYAICLYVQSDGKILVGGNFTNVGGTTRNRLARLNANGSLDTTFNPNSNSLVRSIVVQPDGKMVLCGDFTSMAGVGRNRIARLNANGTLDTSFNPNANASVFSTQLHPDGKLILCGPFTTIGGIGRNRIARLEANGALDLSFNPNAAAEVYFSMPLTDGRILLGGTFTSIGGVTRNRIAMINTDGSLVSTFNPGASSTVATATQQANGLIIIGGAFTTVGGVPRNRVARFDTNGVIDTSFNPNVNDTVCNVSLQADGKVIAAGAFTTTGGLSKNRIALLSNDLASQSLTVASTARIQWLRGGTAQESTEVNFDVSNNSGATWTALGAASRINGGWELNGLSLPSAGTVRASARLIGGYLQSTSGLLQSSTNYSFATPLQIWKQTHLGDPDANDLGDPDFDGLLTLVEYALGTLPHIANGSPLAGTRFSYPEGERLRIFVPRDPTKNDITVEVLAASSLTGPWTIIATSAAGTPFTGPGYFAGDSAAPGLKSVEVRDTVNIADAPVRFLRVKVTH